MPKLPPPPRIAQNRSGLRSALAVTRSPSAVTRSARTRLSAARPYLRDNQPRPPPKVYPVTPTVSEEPDTGASPKGAAARTTSPQTAPGPTRTVRRAGFTSTSAIAVVLTSSPLSAGTRVPWPVAWTASGRSCRRAARTAFRTSAGVTASTTTAGRGSSAGFSVTRWASYCSDPGRCTAPRKAPVIMIGLLLEPCGSGGFGQRVGLEPGVRLDRGGHGRAQDGQRDHDGDGDQGGADQVRG